MLFLDTVVMPVLSQMMRGKEIWAKAACCCALNTPWFCHQNLHGEHSSHCARGAPRESTAPGSPEVFPSVASHSQPPGPALLSSRPQPCGLCLTESQPCSQSLEKAQAGTAHAEVELLPL